MTLNCVQCWVSSTGALGSVESLIHNQSSQVHSSLTSNFKLIPLGESSSLHPVIGKQLDRLGSLALVRQPTQQKENSNFKPTELCLKIDLCHILLNVEGLCKYIQGPLKSWYCN